MYRAWIFQADPQKNNFQRKIFLLYFQDTVNNEGIRTINNSKKALSEFYNMYLYYPTCTYVFLNILFNYFFNVSKRFKVSQSFFFIRQWIPDDIIS